MQMIEWFKTTLLGTIALGACGSILAVGILKLALALVRRISPTLGRTGERIVVAFAYAPQRILEHIKTSRNTNELIVFCLLLLFQISYAITGVVIGMILFVVVSLSPKVDELRFIQVLSQVLLFTSCFVWIYTVRYAFMTYDVFLGDVDAKAMETRRTRETLAEHDGASDGDKPSC